MSISTFAFGAGSPAGGGGGSGGSGDDENKDKIIAKLTKQLKELMEKNADSTFTILQRLNSSFLASMPSPTKPTRGSGGKKKKSALKYFNRSRRAAFDRFAVEKYDEYFESLADGADKEFNLDFMDPSADLYDVTMAKDWFEYLMKEFKKLERIEAVEAAVDAAETAEDDD
jgi:hypothetical protein